MTLDFLNGVQIPKAGSFPLVYVPRQKPCPLVSTTRPGIQNFSLTDQDGVEAVLSGIHLVRIATQVEMIAFLHTLDEWLDSHPKVAAGCVPLKTMLISRCN